MKRQNTILVGVSVAWILAGCSGSTPQESAGKPGNGGSNYHTEGFGDPSVHSLEAKLGLQDCRTCHGQDLHGGTSDVSCDSCHPAAWRTNCTFCHGGLDPTGAPPNDLDGTSDPGSLSFQAHPAHGLTGDHAPFDCIQCHTKPTDVLSSGHVFDDTPGRAEVVFAMGFSHEGVYEGQGQCSNLYCHGTGNGQTGSYDHSLSNPGCDGCHPSSSSSSSQWSAMSGKHKKHLGEGLACANCHVSPDTENPTLHVNGKVDVVFSEANFSQDASSGTCTGVCHGKFHISKSW